MGFVITASKYVIFGGNSRGQNYIVKTENENAFFELLSLRVTELYKNGKILILETGLWLEIN